MTHCPDGPSDGPPAAVGGIPRSVGAAPSLDPVRAPVAWRTNAWLFVATVVSAFATWLMMHESVSRVGALHAAEYTAALMAILLAHEFGHYVAARIHRVEASLPYFIPLPFLSPFGTMGAVIRMRSAIPTRRALLDIGAAGPLAGLALALPLYAWGVSHSEVHRMDGSEGDFVELGGSLLTRLLDLGFAPPAPDGYDVLLSPVAFAGWVGMFVTLINLLPAGQLDAGHVAYALFGPRQNAIAQWVHRSMLAFFFVNLASFVARDIHAGMGFWHFGRHVNNSLFWLVWFEVLAVMGALGGNRGGATDRLGIRIRAFAVFGLAILAGSLHESSSVVVWGAWFGGLAVLIAMEARWGALRKSSALVDHPPTGPDALGGVRAAVAVLTLLLFGLLFMPTPIAL